METRFFKERSPYTISGKPISMPGWFNFAVSYIPPTYGSNKNYISALETKYPEFEKKSISNLDKADLHYFIFSSAKLGWLNCDRFVDDPSPKVNMTLKLKNPEDLMIKMVYKDFKSVIPPRYDDNVHYFENIPENKEITLLIIRSKKNKVEMSITEQITQEGEIKNIKFKDYTMSELKKELEKLN